MCFGRGCPYEIKSGPSVGECTLTGKDLQQKCPRVDPIFQEIIDAHFPERDIQAENDRLYDLIYRIDDLVGMYLPTRVHKELDRLICDAQLSDDYRTRVQELEEELKALKDTPF